MSGEASARDSTTSINTALGHTVQHGWDDCVVVYSKNKGGREAKGRRKGKGGEEEGGEIERERKRERQRGTREIEIQGEVAIPDGGSQRMIK